MGQGGVSRRRGDRLMESIYDAALEIIREQGYGNLTFQKIARAAHTSRTVLYRRWATPLNLIWEILHDRLSRSVGEALLDGVKDTGSLRGDLIYLLTLYQQFFADAGPEIVNAALFEMSQHSAQMIAIKDNAVLQNIRTMEKIIAFAEGRGERVKTPGPVALALPFDLIRAQFLWGSPAFDQAALEQLVDEILLPIFKG